MLKLIIFLRRNVKLKTVLYIFEFFPYIISVTANIGTIKTTETREVQIGLKHDGSLMDSYNLPKCGSDQTIHLVSYKYHQLQCHFADDCILVHEEPLLPDEVFHLHQMCSMQQQCRNLSFPLRSEAQRNRTNAIMIRYECIDQSRLVNICEKGEMTFSYSVYLTSADIKESFKECQCFVLNGRFIISIIDIRLNDNKNSNCSPATLHVNDKEFLCDERRNDYGAVFSQSLREPLSNAYISLVQNSNTTFPDIILMGLQPEISSNIICQGPQTTWNINVNRSTSVGRSNGTPKLLTTTARLPIDNVTKSVILPETTYSQHNRTSPALLIITLLLSTLLLMSTVLIYYLLLHRRKQLCSEQKIEAVSFDLAEMKPQIKSNFMSVETQALLDQLLAIFEAESLTDEDSTYSSSADEHSPCASDNKNRGSTVPMKNKKYRLIHARRFRKKQIKA